MYYIIYKYIYNDNDNVFINVKNIKVCKIYNLSLDIRKTFLRFKFTETFT